MATETLTERERDALTEGLMQATGESFDLFTAHLGTPQECCGANQSTVPSHPPSHVSRRTTAARTAALRAGSALSLIHI